MKSARSMLRLVALLAALFCFALSAGAAQATGGKGGWKSDSEGDKAQAHGPSQGKSDDGGDDGSERRSHENDDHDDSGRVENQPHAKSDKGSKGDTHQNGPASSPKAKDDDDEKPQAAPSKSHGKAKGSAKADASSDGNGKSKTEYRGNDKGQGEDREKEHRGDHKHTICHATGSSSNPYVMITPSVSGVYHGHIAHQHGEDIIPPFTYKGVTYSQNWNAAGQALFAAGCRPAAPAAADVCPNIAGHQDKVPGGHDKDTAGNCVLKAKEQKPDVCPNIEGHQSEVPAGMVRDSSGNCVLKPKEQKPDVCPNIEGHQSEVPAGLVKDAQGNCVTPAPVVAAVDVCPNIEGHQSEVPAGKVKDAQGNCVTPVTVAAAPPSTPAPAKPAKPAPAPIGNVAGKATRPAKGEAPAAEEGPDSGVLGETASAPEAVAETGDSGGTLPFTGIPLWIAVLLGGGLLLSGLAIRRASQH